MKKSIRTIGILMVVAGLLLTGTLGVSAANITGVEIRGTITSISKDADTITVTKGTTQVIIMIYTYTVITKTGIGTATINDLAVNDRVDAVYGRDNGDTWVANVISAGQPLASYKTFVGTIKSKTPESLILTVKKVDTNVLINSQTKYKVAGVSSASYSNFNVGDNIAVLSVNIGTTDAPSYVALNLNFLPTASVFSQNVGSVTAYDTGRSVTIKNISGILYTYSVDSNTEIKSIRGTVYLVPGDLVTVVAERNIMSNEITALSITGLKQ